MPIRINPFIYSRPVQPEEFVGREPELRRLFSRLATGQSTAIIGLPHVGKSSLLNTVIDPARRQALFGEEFKEDLFQILDAQMLRSVRSQTEFWAQALCALDDAINAGQPAKIQQVKAVFEMARANNYGTFVLEQLFNAFGEAGIRYMLFLDEFDDLLSHPVLNSAEFYGSLRSLASRSNGLVLVLGSRRDIEQLNTLTQAINPHGSPYFNVFTQITLKTLSEPAFLQLIGRGGKHFREGDAEFIRAVSGRYPFLVQAVSAKLWEADEDGLRDYQRYEYAGRELYNEAKQHFSDTWRVWTNEVRRAVTAVALSQIPALVGNHAFSRSELLNSLSDFAPELEMLEDLGLLQQDEERLSVTQGAFLWWLADELKRNVRSETEFKSWLQAQEMDGVLTVQQKEQLAKTTSTILGQLGKGAATLIEAFAKGAASAALNKIGFSASKG
jgi:hypothetical protein